MKTNVLIVSPVIEFRELVCQALNETGLYEVHEGNDQDSSIEVLRSNPNCRFALLDTNLGDHAIIELSNSIRNQKWDLHIVLISAEEDLTRFDDLRPWKVLHKPFPLSDLLEVLGGNWPTVINVDSSSVSSEPGLPWMLSPDHANKILTDLISRLNIHEAIITRDRTVWASTGAMSSSAIRDINLLINRQNKFEDKYDLFRYIWVDGVRKEYKLYAISILLNTVLALIFDLVTPTHDIREDANLIAEQLLLPMLPDSMNHLNSRSANKSYLLPSQHNYSFREHDTLNINSGIDHGYIKFDDLKLNPQVSNHSQPIDINQQPIIIPPGNQVIQINKLRVSSTGQSVQSPAIYLDTDLLGADLVTFSGLLTPRFADQPLKGNIAQILYSKFPQICISYGWRLWSIEISMDCVQWIVDVPPDLSPLKHVRIIKKLTSEYLAEENELYMNKNVSNDFWAAGFSITGGKHHYSSTEVESFVHKIRLAYQIFQ